MPSLVKLERPRKEDTDRTSTATTNERGYVALGKISLRPGHNGVLLVASAI
jgi:hypothetical protein